MSKLSDELQGILNPEPNRLSAPGRVKTKHPSGFDPGVHLKGDEGTICGVTEAGSHADFDTLLRKWGYDPVKFELLDDTVEVRTWDVNLGDGVVDTMWYHKAKVRRRQPGIALADMDELKSLVSRHRPRRTAVVGECDMLVALSDWQIGKDDGDGTQGTVRRILQMIDDVSVRIEEFRKTGKPIRTLYVVGLGDLVEGTCDFYPQQSYRVELDRRDQVKMTWRLLLKAVTTWAKQVERLVAAAVGGNHGENRREGRSYTTFADNDDLLVMEVVRDVIRENPEAYGHVEFAIPVGDESLAVTLDIDGVTTSFVHGHQASGRGKAHEKVWNWWTDQIAGRVPGVGDAALLVSGHYHYYASRLETDRAHIQVPPMDGGSAWFEMNHGGRSRAGTMTCLVGERWGGFDFVSIGAGHVRDVVG